MHTDLTPSDEMSRVVDGKRYTVGTATLIAHDRYWDGNNFDRNGRNSFLYKTKNGRFFIVHRTAWQGESDTLRPIDQQEAVEEYEALREQIVSYEDAFPQVKIEEA